MAIIYSYPSATPVEADVLLITQASDPSKASKSITLGSIKSLFGITDPINGSGTAGVIPVFDGEKTITNSIIAISGGATSIGGALNVGGATVLDDNLTIEGSVDLNSSIDISGNTVLQGAVVVNGASIFNDSVTAVGDSTFGEDDGATVTMEATLNLQGPIKDSSGILGGNEQVLVSNAAGSVAWANSIR